jgi:hypothetical protein
VGSWNCSLGGQNCRLSRELPGNAILAVPSATASDFMHSWFFCCSGIQELQHSRRIPAILHTQRWIPCPRVLLPNLEELFYGQNPRHPKNLFAFLSFAMITLFSPLKYVPRGTAPFGSVCISRIHRVDHIVLLSARLQSTSAAFAPPHGPPAGLCGWE